MFFKKKKDDKKGLKDLLNRQAKVTFAPNQPLSEKVKLPKDESEANWVFENASEFHLQLQHLFHQVSQQGICTSSSCPKMTAGPKYEYMWRDPEDPRYLQPTAVPAPLYCSLLFAWIDKVMGSEEEMADAAVLKLCKDIFRRELRFFSHIYVCHGSVLDEEFIQQLNGTFEHFVYFIKEFSLFDKSELEPLQPFVDAIEKKTKIQISKIENTLSPKLLQDLALPGSFQQALESAHEYSRNTVARNFSPETHTQLIKVLVSTPGHTQSVEYEKVLRTLKNLASKDFVRPLFKEKAILDPLLVLLDSTEGNEDVLYSLAGNLCLDPSFAEILSQREFLPKGISFFAAHPDNEEVVNFLIHVMSAQGTRELLVDQGVISILQRSLKANPRSWVLLFTLTLGRDSVASKLKVLKEDLLSHLSAKPDDLVAQLCLANIFGKDEREKDTSQASESLMKQMTQLLNRLEATQWKNSGSVYSLEDLLATLENLSINNDNKVFLVKSGVATPLWKILVAPGDALSSEREHVLSIMSHLALIPENVPALRQVVSVEVLKKVKLSANSANVLSLLLSQLGTTSSSSPSLSTPSSAPPKNHVMLSYNWTHKKEVLEVRKHFSSRSFPVWIDVESMGENIVDGMVSAVQGAAVVVIFVSQFYMRSANCRYEAEFSIMKLKKPVIFVMVEPQYDPEGWLALLMGSSLYIDLRSKDSWKERLEELSGRVEDILSKAGRLPTGPPAIAAPPATTTTTPAAVATPATPATFVTTSPPRSLIIRKYGAKRGGELIAMPTSLEALLEEGGKLLRVAAVAVRTFPEEARVRDLSLVTSGTMVILLTKEQEAEFD